MALVRADDLLYLLIGEVLAAAGEGLDAVEAHALVFFLRLLGGIGGGDVDAGDDIGLAKALGRLEVLAVVGGGLLEVLRSKVRSKGIRQAELGG